MIERGKSLRWAKGENMLYIMRRIRVQLTLLGESEYNKFLNKEYQKLKILFFHKKKVADLIQFFSKTYIEKIHIN